MTFAAPITQIGRRTVIVLPFDPVEVWGDRDRFSVRGTVHGQPWRGKVQWFAEGPAIALGPAWLRDNPVETTEVEVTLTLEGHQSANLDADVAAIMTPERARRFDSLTSFDRNNLMRPILNAKRFETRARNIQALAAFLDERP
jgi:hypothetical protein